MAVKKTLKKVKVGKEPTRISIADFEVESSEASLEELEDCMNRLINKNKDFAEFRRRKTGFENYGMFG